MALIAYFFPFIYVSLTIILYFIGPWGFVSLSSETFNIFISMVPLAIFLGNLLGFFDRKLKSALLSKNIGLFLFKFSLLIGFLLYFPTVFARTGFIYPNIILGFMDPAAAYARAIDPIYPQIEYFRIFLSPMLIAIFPLGIIYWELLTNKCKFLYVLYCILYSSLFISMGVNRGIFDVILGVSFCVFFVCVKKRSEIKLRHVAIILLFIILFCLGLYLFAKGQMHREGSGALSGFLPFSSTYARWIPEVIDDELIRYLVLIYNQLSSYLSQGYYGASLLYEQSISGQTYGVGFSDFLLRNATKILGDEFLLSSPIYALENANDWLHGNYWFSILGWLSSDFTFLGALFVVFIFSFIYSSALNCFILTSCWLSFLIVYLMLFVFLYFPANNYMFQSGETFFYSVFFMSLWGVRKIQFCCTETIDN
ncbi:oligosaccharide repeat unit polymerase [Aeromonas jandaei]|uniref:oligosaccharide repeat unit polymerase n=1 Tax=Aeromonas jandaei TaxID=650 RepID=UPI00191CB0B2|nr:oligosaccharide repeat unit polymerase [Aeromonas jandaei]MBL0608715.1 oligosaccharide repeat unit polymerase [Aeromonas jandaei]